MEEHAIACDWRNLAGVHALMTQDLYEVVAALVAALRKEFPELAASVKLVGPDEKGGGTTLADLRIPAAKGAVVQSHAASLWPYRLVCAVLSRLVDDVPSFNLQTMTPVTDLRPAAGGGWALTTPRGRITARRVLLAANGYTSRLLAPFADLIVPVRGQVGALLPPSHPPPVLEHSYVFVGSEPRPGGRDEYLVQRPPSGEAGAELILGGGRTLAQDRGVGQSRDDVVEPAVAAYLRSTLGASMRLDPQPGGDGEEKKAAPELRASYEWTGVMGYSRDGHPWVGRVPLSAGGGDGLFVCAGYTGHGMATAPLCARAVAEMMVDDDDEGEAVLDLPRAYVVSDERIQRARDEWDELAVVDQQGIAFHIQRLYATLA